MVTALWLMTSAVPSEIGGMPTWILNGVGVVSLLMMVVGGLASSRLYTSRQVDQIIARYDTHMARTIENMQGRIDDAVRRETEWRDVAMQFKEAFQAVEATVEPMQLSNQTMLSVLRQIQSMQREADSHDQR